MGMVLGTLSKDNPSVTCADHNNEERMEKRQHEGGLSVPTKKSVLGIDCRFDQDQSGFMDRFIMAASILFLPQSHTSRVLPI